MSKRNVLRCNWTLGLGAAAAAVLLAGPWACSKAETAPSSGAAAEQTPAQPQQNRQRARRVEIKVTGSGYEPARVEARAGERLTLVFTRVSDEGCGHKVVLPDFDIRRDLPLNQPVAITITPPRTGEFRITCGMNMYKGAIVVR